MVKGEKGKGEKKKLAYPCAHKYFVDDGGAYLGTVLEAKAVAASEVAPSDV
jgi:hypothetical protein